jgi:hypothetical protein
MTNRRQFLAGLLASTAPLPAFVTQTIERMDAAQQWVRVVSFASHEIYRAGKPIAACDLIEGEVVFLNWNVAPPRFVTVDRHIDERL